MRPAHELILQFKILVKTLHFLIKMDRSHQYKPSSSTVDDLRARRRTEDAEARKSRRSRVINSKRVRLDSAGEDDDVTVEQVQEAAKIFVAKEGNRKMLLRLFKKAFAQGTLLTEMFLKVDNAMSALVGALSGSDANLQLEAAWCLTNMAAGTHDQATAVLQAAGAYLVTYLTSGNHPLQYQCSWALGNVAGDGPECRDALGALGAIQPLIDLLMSPLPHIVQSAAFALSNLCRGPAANTQWLVDLGMVTPLVAHLTYKENNLEVIAEAAWVITYLAASGEHEDILVTSGCVQQLAALMVALAKNNPDDYKTFTPTLRCLGNLCSAADHVSELACQNPLFIPSLGKCLTSSHRHIKKETLWVLSNITGSQHVAKLVVSNGLLAPIISLLDSTYDMKQESAYTLCNIASHERALCEETLQQGALSGMVPLLKSPDPDLANMSLSYTELVLRQVPGGKDQFEEARGLEGLEGLEYHENDALREEANNILDKYFYHEDVMAEDEMR